MMSTLSYVIGIDFGSDSVRTIIVDTSNGKEIAASLFFYPRWQKQLYCIASENQFRQHPLDYVQGLEQTIKSCVEQVDASVVKNIKAISVDTTGSTPIAVDKTGTPLALLPGFEENPNAMFLLWKDHTSINEAADINDHAKKFEINYLRYVGGIYSSEWFWAKLLHILRKDEKVRNAVYSFVEHCDWIPFLLTGCKDVHEMKRSVCSAGHKILWAKDWGGLPPNEFFASLDPMLDGFNERLFNQTYTADTSAGIISQEWAVRLGLPIDVKIGVGALDAHMGAVGGQIEPYYLSKVMGTSTCDLLVAPLEEVQNRLVAGICGQVNGSIIPGMIGMEAGQSAFGDVYAWFKNILSWPITNVLSNSTSVSVEVLQLLIDETLSNLIYDLSKQAEALPLEEYGELAIDWFNGRRTPDANHTLKGAISGLSLGSDAVKMYRALAESTCFGAKAIVDRFIEQGIPIKGLIGMGGVAKKSPFIMQMMADVIGMPIRIHKSEQTCALGAAMFAATVARVFEKVEDAMEAMGQGFEAEYLPNIAKDAIYKERYAKYKSLAKFLEMSLL
jgi:L-ribulokinase